MLINLVSYFADFSHWLNGAGRDGSSLNKATATYSTRVVEGSLLLLFIMIVIAVIATSRKKHIKVILFIIISVIITSTTALLTISTLYLYANSDSKGFTKREAAIGFWVCGNEINILDPSGISKRIGRSNIYEKNDNLVHIDGVVADEASDASLGGFMDAIGGTLVNDAVVIPVNPSGSIFTSQSDGNGRPDPFPSQAQNLVTLIDGSRYIKALNGQMCGDKEAQVQVFAYTFDESSNTYRQKKLDNPQNYIFSDKTTVPPGDCIIVEFDALKDQTDKLCYEYGKADSDRCVQFGTKDTSACTAKQEGYSPVGSGIDPNLNKEVY